MKQLYTPNYIGTVVYQMDSGFGEFVGYGGSVSCGLVSEEALMRGKT
ncbi:MAG: hypothetical protein J5965_21640 [Aeriscardovia sp.]|nr:hypothetical protein [Aeriscardovia sp.]MBO6253450.1 hypothetical protein [Bacteroidaceae bacterium]